MFIKNVYKNAFYMPNYKILAKKSLIRVIMYTLLLVLFSGTMTIYLGYVSKKDSVNDIIEKSYNLIPDFTLSGKEGFDIDSDGPIVFSFAGLEFYIDDSRELTNLILDEKVEDGKVVMFVASDGYGTVNGSVLERASYYKHISKLNNITLNKDDFSIIYETIQFIVKDIFIVVGVICLFLFMILVLIKSLAYSTLLKLVAKYKGKRVLFKDTLKVVLYAHTFYILYYGVVLLSPMNLGLPVKMMLFEIISLFNVLYIGLNYKKEVF